MTLCNFTISLYSWIKVSSILLVIDWLPLIKWLMMLMTLSRIFLLTVMKIRGCCYENWMFGFLYCKLSLINISWVTYLFLCHNSPYTSLKNSSKPPQDQYKAFIKCHLLLQSFVSIYEIETINWKIHSYRHIYGMTDWLRDKQSDEETNRQTKKGQKKI